MAVKDPFLLKASGYRFYNTSEYTFEKLKADPENIKANFEAYLNGFSDNVMDILARMDFFTQLERMSNAGLLYQVISDFCTDKADMNPEKISAVDMGYIFENLVQRFSESYDEEAGAHFTSRDIIYLMCDLLTDRMGMANEGRMYTAYEGTDIERAVNIIIWSMEGFAAKEQAKLKAHSVTELHFNEILSEMLNMDRDVAIYARVSTEHEEQLSALENQKEWYRPILSMHPEWHFKRMYVEM